MKKRLIEIIEDGYGRLSSKRMIGIIGVINSVVFLDYLVLKAVEAEKWSVASGIVTWCITTFVGLLGIGALVERKNKNKDDEGKISS